MPKNVTKARSVDANKVNPHPNISSPGLERFKQLMRQGHIAQAKGNCRQAHHLWRKAAIMNPGDEQVWVALFKVLDNVDDQRVCLENILAINPYNQQAQRQLNALLQKSPTDALVKQSVASRRSLRHMLQYLSVRGAETLLLAFLIALGLILVNEFILPVPILSYDFLQIFS